MSTEIKLDVKMFNRALHQYIGGANKDAVEAFNVKAYYVARNAAMYTKKAGKKEIRSYYNRKNTAAVVAAVKWKKLTRANSRAELTAALKAMKAARIKAVGSLCAGWLPAIKAFGGWAKQPKSLKGVMQRGRKGRAKVAKRSDGMKAHAMIENFLPSKTKDTAGAGRALSRWGARGLQAAFKKEAFSMEKYLIKKLKKTAKELHLR
jgi:hypothetical protein